MVKKDDPFGKVCPRVGANLVSFGEGRIFSEFCWCFFFENPQPILQDEDPPPWREILSPSTALVGPLGRRLEKPPPLVSGRCLANCQKYFKFFLGWFWVMTEWWHRIFCLVFLMVKLLFFGSQTSLDIRRWRMILGHHSCFRAKIEL